MPNFSLSVCYLNRQLQISFPLELEGTTRHQFGTRLSTSRPTTSSPGKLPHSDTGWVPKGTLSHVHIHRLIHIHVMITVHECLLASIEKVYLVGNTERRDWPRRGLHLEGASFTKSFAPCQVWKPDKVIYLVETPEARCRGWVFTWGKNVPFVWRTSGGLPGPARYRSCHSSAAVANGTGKRRIGLWVTRNKSFLARNTKASSHSQTCWVAQKHQCFQTFNRNQLLYLSQTNYNQMSKNHKALNTEF